MKDCLVLLTKVYPFDKGEEFIENEVPVLAEAFEKIILIATAAADHPVQTRETPGNVSVYSLRASQIKRGLPLAAAKLFPFYGFRGNCGREERQAVRGSLRKRLYLTYFLAKSELVYRGAYRILAECALERYDAVTFYSYWFYDTALAAARLKETLGPGVKRAVSRAHGYDLYPDRNPLHYLPMRGELLRRLDMLYPCSQNGSNYLMEQYPAYRDKIRTAYLGTSDFGLPEQTPGGPFVIASCCHIVPVKRVELLAQALAKLNGCGFRIKWIHFGGGGGLDELKKFAAESLSFMECEFPGEVPNAALMKYYKTHRVDIFVNTSSSEGLPVSIMEACSFGIPAIATDVGGTGEIVRDGETGSLVRADITPEELAAKLRSAAELPDAERQRLRKNCRALWEREFWAERNFTRFAQDIKPIS